MKIGDTVIPQTGKFIGTEGVIQGWRTINKDQRISRFAKVLIHGRLLSYHPWNLKIIYSKEKLKMKRSTKKDLVELCEAAIHEKEHEQFNGISESGYQSFMELKNQYIQKYTDCINELEDLWI
jgi:glutaredoxin 2